MTSQSRALKTLLFRWQHIDAAIKSLEELERMRRAPSISRVMARPTATSRLVKSYSRSAKRRVA